MTTVFMLIIFATSGVTTIGPYSSLDNCNQVEKQINEYFVKGEMRAVCLPVK